GAGIPRVVFPEREISARRERFQDVVERASALFGLDMVKDAVAIRESELSGNVETAGRVELQTQIDIRSTRDFHAVGRRADADDETCLELFKEFRSAAAGATPEIKDGRRLRAQVGQARRQPPDAFASEVVLRLAGQRQPLVQRGVVGSSVGVK